MKNRVVVIAAAALSLFLGLLLLLKTSGPEEIVVSPDGPGRSAAGPALASQTEKSTHAEKPIPSDTPLPEGPKQPAQLVEAPPQFVLVRDREGNSVPDARVFLLAPEQAFWLSEKNPYFREGLHSLEAEGLKGFEGLSVESAGKEVPPDSAGRFPLLEADFDEYEGFVVAKGWTQARFRPAETESGVTVVVLQRETALRVDFASLPDPKRVCVEMEDLDSPRASSRYFLLTFEAGRAEAIEVKPGKYRYRAWADTGSGNLWLAEAGPVVECTPGAERTLSFAFAPLPRDYTSEAVTVRLVYEGENVSLPELLEKALDRAGDELSPQRPQACVQFQKSENGPIEDHDFFRCRSNNRFLQFDLARARFYSLNFTFDELRLTVRRWGIFPQGQSIDIHLGRHDFPKGSGSLRVRIDSDQDEKGLETRLFKCAGRIMLPAGGKRGKDVAFKDLEPGTYETHTRVTGVFDLFVPVKRRIEIEGGPAELSVSLGGLHALDLTIVDASNLAAESSVYPPFTVFLSGADPAEAETLNAEKKQNRIGGLQPGRYMVSAGVWAEAMFLSAPVEATTGPSPAASSVAIGREGKEVFFYRDLLGDRAFDHELRIFDRQDRLVWNFKAYLAQQMPLRFPADRYRIEVFSQSRKETVESCEIDLTGPGRNYHLERDQETDRIVLKEAVEGPDEEGD